MEASSQKLRMTSNIGGQDVEIAFPIEVTYDFKQNADNAAEPRRRKMQRLLELEEFEEDARGLLRPEAPAVVPCLVSRKSAMTPLGRNVIITSNVHETAVPEREGLQHEISAAADSGVPRSFSENTLLRPVSD
jgi:hypothetical protein